MQCFIISPFFYSFVVLNFLFISSVNDYLILLTFF